MKQAAVADRLVITKTDLIEPSIVEVEVAQLRAKLRTFNNFAPIVERYDSAFRFESLFDTSLYDPNTKSMDVRKWLNVEAEINDSDHHHGYARHHSHEPDQDPHDVTRHGTDIRSFVLTFDDPLPIEAFCNALEALTRTQGANLLRIKGIVCTTERPGRPIVIHGVQHVFHDPVWLDDWPDEDKRTRIVFITHRIERNTLERYFRKWISAEWGI